MLELTHRDLVTLASMLCDYATIENCLAPDEVDIIIKIAVQANFPQDSIERLWRIHADAVATLEQ
jgi:hypothetical protein